MNMDQDGPDEPEDSGVNPEADDATPETVSQKENITESAVPIQDGGFLSCAVLNGQIQARLPG